VYKAGGTEKRIATRKENSLGFTNFYRPRK
jgi:hypothetical protein